MQRLQAGEIWKGWQNAEERKTALVFTTSDGNYISHTSIRYHFKKIVKQIGAPDCRVHDLRHPYVKHTTKNIFLQKQKSQTINDNLIVWGFCFCVLFLFS